MTREEKAAKEEVNMQPVIYRVSEFCQKYAISRTSFYREVWAERLQVIKRGRLTFVAREEAERWFHDLGYIKTKETIVKRQSVLTKST